jgi:GMP synthase-like glutamine amidotransferase
MYMYQQTHPPGVLLTGPTTHGCSADKLPLLPSIFHAFAPPPPADGTTAAPWEALSLCSSQDNALSSFTDGNSCVYGRQLHTEVYTISKGLYQSIEALACRTLRFFK